LAWLSPDLDAVGAKALCVPLAPQLLIATPANPLLNKVASGVAEGPELLVGAAA
jgi:hypothetical protein